MKVPFLLGRILFGGYFLYNGINHFRQHEMLTQYAGAKKVPNPDIGVAASGALLAFGGASVVLGVTPKLGTLAIIAFLAGVSPVMHDFWNAGDPSQRSGDMIHFGKNMALMGGALALMGVEEPWPLSVPASGGQCGKRALRR